MPQATPLYRNIDFAENLSLVKTEREFHALIDKLYSEDKVIGFDIETGYSGADTPGGALNTYSDTQFISGFSITNSPNWARYIPLRHDFGDNLDPNVVWPHMKHLLEEKPTVAHNCFTGDTEAVIRNEGSIRLDSLVGQRKEVLTEEGWRWADFRSYGKSEVRKIVLAPSHSSRTALTHTVYATPNHRWYLQDGRVVTTDELHPYIRWAPGVRAAQGTHIKANPLPTEYDEDGFRHGLIFADGSLNTKQPKEAGVWTHQIRLCGHKAKYSHLFDVTYPPSANGDPVANRYKSTVNCKELPPQDASDAYVASFIQGWMALDGHWPKPNKCVVSTVTKEHSDWLVENGYRSGFIVRGASSRETVGTYSNKPLTCYSINLAVLDDPYWEVRSVEEVGGEFEVFCAEVVDGPPQFTLKGGILTGNCVYEAENLRNLDHKGDGPDIDLFKGGAYDSMIEAYILADVPPSPIDGSIEEGALVERYIPPFHQDGFGYQSPEIKRFMVGLKSLTKFRYNYDQKDIYSLFAGKELTAKQKTMIRFNTLPLSPEVVHYACDDAYLCLQLHHDQMERINEDEFFPNLYKLEMEIAEILVEMREVGITVDWDSLTRYKMQREKFVHELEVKTKKSFEAEIGHALPELNLRSPQQLKNLIFNPKDEGGLGLHGTRTTKSGSLSTDDKALGVVRKDSPAVNQLLLHRQAIKTGEWVEAWEGLKNEAWDHKIHPSFIQVRVPSGRFASAGPNCLKGDVDVLTPRGWVQLQDLKDGEEVAQVNEAGEATFVIPSRVIRKDFSGNGVHIKSPENKGWLDLWTTPDHRFLSYSRKTGKAIWETGADWLSKWEGTNIVDRKLMRAGVRTQGRHLTQEERINLETAIACQADGTSSGPCWGIKVRKPRKINQLDSLGVEYRYFNATDVSARVRKDTVDAWLLPNKTFNTEAILSLSLEDLQFFMEAVMRWDGDSTRSNRYLQHPDRSSDVDTVQAVAALSGISTSRYTYHRRDSDGELVDTPYPSVNINPNQFRCVSRVNISEEYYEGKVYCVTVPTGAFLIRSNGSVLATGNCQNITKTWWYQIPGGSKADVIRSGVAGDDYWMGNARAVITASPGYKLLAFDYKSAEIQFVAALAGEQSIVEAFERGDDFHKWAASIMYSKDINLVTKNERQSAKSFSFGSIYQQGIKSLGEQLGVSLEEAQKLQDMYFAAFPHLEAFFENQKRLCAEDHEVRTWLGRKITLWEGMHENQRVRAKAKNIAINAPVQGGATGDYVKIAMVNVRRALKAKGWWGKEVRLLMNQHDSLVFEFSEDIDMQELIDILTPEVSFSLKGIKGLYNYFEVFPPMSVDWETGYTWGTLEEVGTPDYTDATKLTVEISTKATREDLKAVMDVLTLNEGTTPVEIRLGGEVMSAKRGVRPVQAVLDKLKKGDPDNGVYTSPGEVVQAHFDVV